MLARQATAGDDGRASVQLVQLRPGEYEVVLAPEPVATIAVFLDFYGFNGKACNEGQSFVELGAGQFDPRITMVDDPMGRGALGEAYDAEGTPKQPTVLIDAGVTRTAVHDRRSARRAGSDSTGHAWAMSGSLGEFRKLRATMTEYARTTGDNLRAYQTLEGDIDVYQWFLMISTHSQRHILQIREIKAHAEFPKKS